MTSKIKNYVIIALTILGLLLFTAIGIKSCKDAGQIQKLEDKISMLETSKDSLKRTYDTNLDQFTYTIRSYEASQKMLREDLGKYSKALEKIIKDNPKASSGFSADTETKVDKVFDRDTSAKDTFPNNPVYTYKLKEEFYEGTAAAYPDSLKLKLAIKTGLVGVFNDGKISVTPTNKDVVITGLEGFNVKPEQKKNRFWRNFLIGVGVGAVTTGIILR